ncbi:sensor histidine kinase [Lachnospira intestinalis]|uniref:histidine kinase n=1 Tax=Lachnospira intestinalis TaxID=3133158 RepID=A0ABV1H1C3_9FIRM
MEKKKKRVFVLGLVALLSVISIGMILLCRNIQSENQGTQTVDVSAVSREMLLFMLDQTRVVNKDYSVLSLGEDVPYSIRSELEYVMEEELLTARADFINSPNFAYRITNTATGEKTEGGDTSLFVKDHQMYSTFTYDADGNVTSTGDYVSTDFTYMSAYQLLKNSISISTSNARETYEIYGKSIPKSQIQLRVPQNLKAEFAIPQNLTENNDIIWYNTENLVHGEMSGRFLAVTCCMMVFFIGLYILFYPVSVEQEVNLFAFMRKIKAEIKWAFLGTVLCLAYIGMAFLDVYTMTGELQTALQMLGIPYAELVPVVLQFIGMMLTGLFTAMGIFEIKYMLTSGFCRYWKEDSLIGSICGNVKRRFEKLSEVDLSDKTDTVLLKYVLIQMVIVGVIACFWSFGIVLSVLYSVLLFFYIRKKLKKVQKDYQVLLEEAHQLADGRFDEEITQDVGIFNALGDELKNVRIGFEKAVSEEIKSQNMKTELISNVSHDLKTPLTGIKNYAELLGQDNVSGQDKQVYLENLQHYIDRLNNLIEDLFEVSKVNSGNIELNPVELNVVALIQQAQAETEDLLKQKNLTVILDAPENGIVQALDGDKTYRIFENLFTNIAKYTLPGTRVYVSATAQPEYTEIVFKNISEAQMNFTPEEIVERFVRGDKSRHESGSGIGLAIVKSFTEVQNGTFSIEIDGDLFKAVVRFKVN